MTTGRTATEPVTTEPVIKEQGRLGDDQIERLAHILHANVQEGASVGFVAPFSLEDAAAYWRGRVVPALRDGSTLLWTASHDGEIVGTVQLGFSPYPNQARKGDVAKLLVDPAARRRGVARALMDALTGAALARGLKTLVLDTESESPAVQFYGALGFEVAGTIPDYAIAPSGDGFVASTYLYKRL